MSRVRIVLFLAVVVVFGLAAGAAPGAGAASQAGDPVKGQKIYASATPKCNLCHKIGAAGGKLGPDLSTVGTKRDAAWLAKYLANPKMVDAKNKMPAVKVKGQELDDLIAYLLTLKK